MNKNTVAKLIKPFFGKNHIRYALDGLIESGAHVYATDLEMVLRISDNYKKEALEALRLNDEPTKPNFDAIYARDYKADEWFNLTHNALLAISYNEIQLWRHPVSLAFFDVRKLIAILKLPQRKLQAVTYQQNQRQALRFESELGDGFLASYIAPTEKIIKGLLHHYPELFYAMSNDKKELKNVAISTKK